MGIEIVDVRITDGRIIYDAVRYMSVICVEVLDISIAYLGIVYDAVGDVGVVGIEVRHLRMIRNDICGLYVLGRQVLDIADCGLEVLGGEVLDLSGFGLEVRYHGGVGGESVSLKNIERTFKRGVLCDEILNTSVGDVCILDLRVSDRGDISLQIANVCGNRFYIASHHCINIILRINRRHRWRCQISVNDGFVIPYRHGNHIANAHINFVDENRCFLVVAVKPNPPNAL